MNALPCVHLAISHHHHLTLQVLSRPTRPPPGSSTTPRVACRLTTGRRDGVSDGGRWFAKMMCHGCPKSVQTFRSHPRCNHVGDTMAGVMEDAWEQVVPRLFSHPNPVIIH